MKPSYRCAISLLFLLIAAVDLPGAIAATITVGSITANCGANAGVAVSISSPNSEAFSRLDFQIDYDPSQLKFFTMSREGLINDSWFVDPKEVSASTVQITMRPPLGSYSGNIGSLIFTVLPSATNHTTTALQVSRVQTSIGGLFLQGSGIPGAATINCLQQQTPPPSAPLLTATAQSVSSVSLSWNAVEGATEYRLFRGSTQVYRGAATSYLDGSLAAATQFCYSARAVAEVGESAPSPEACTTTPAACVPPATAPAISGTAEGTSAIRLTWSAVTGATGYRLLRGSTEIYRGADQSFLDTGLSPSSQNCYSVQATSPCGDGPQSSQSCITTPASCTAPTNASTLSVIPVSSSSTLAQWTAVPNATTYVLNRGTTEVYRGDQTSFQDERLLADTQYCYTAKALDACGEQTSSIACARTSAAPATTYYFAPFAGPESDGPGASDGIGPKAAFNVPEGVCTDPTGNVYVADSLNSTIRKITPDGVVTTLAGTAGKYGSSDGEGARSRFLLPYSVAMDSAGNAYVADSFNSTVRKISPTGRVTTLAGSPGEPGSNDGQGADARFSLPLGIATDSAANIYVADTLSYTIRKITPTGLVTTLAGTPGQRGSSDGVGAAARFNYPNGVATDTAGNLYVVDQTSIRKINPNGVVTTLARGKIDWPQIAFRISPFIGLGGIATDSAGNIFVADATNTVKKFAPDGNKITANPTGGFPGGVATDHVGNVYVAVTGTNSILRINSDGTVSTIAGSPVQVGSSDGIGASAEFNQPSGVASDNAGSVYVADSGNNTIRKISPAGVVTTLAGDPDGNRGSEDGVGVAARFFSPRGVATDNAGNLYIADHDNQTVRKITPAGMVTTFAGTAGQNGSADGVGADARFISPSAVASDTAGNVYVADTGNNTVRKITPAGVVTTLAGSAYQSGSIDGVGADARFTLPLGVATDKAQNVYVADTGNHTIRKISPTGVVTTVGGIPGLPGHESGTGGDARFSSPTGIAIAPDGSIIVSNVGSNSIWRGVLRPIIPPRRRAVK